jgi:DNA-binding transcriptional regulator LsrR (DeoR family)
MKAYSLDLRQRILAVCQHGNTNQEVAERFAVSVDTVQRYQRRLKETGTVAPKPIPTKKRSQVQGQIFFEPVDLGRQPPDLLVQLGDLGLLRGGFVVSLRAVLKVGSEFRESGLLPLGDQVRVDLMLGSQFRNRLRLPECRQSEEPARNAAVATGSSVGSPSRWMRTIMRQKKILKTKQCINALKTRPPPYCL